MINSMIGDVTQVQRKFPGWFCWPLCLGKFEWIGREEEFRSRSLDSVLIVQQPVQNCGQGEMPANMYHFGLAYRNLCRNPASSRLASELLCDGREDDDKEGDRMNKPIEINPWCVASVFFAIGVVMFLGLHPLNCVSSGCSPISSLFVALLNP
jgi:hypothetical protein